MFKLFCLAATAALAANAAWAAAPAPPGAAKLVASELLPNVPGKRLSANLVTYPPGGKSGPHTHGGSVLAYVVSGSIRSAIDDGEVRVYRAGESFFERPGQLHRVSENASDTEPASLLAIIIADDGKPTTTPAAPAN
jgi:quercetin dioxygenase-like cupin family protein